MAGGEGKFMLALTSGTLHMDPAHEECNVDAVPRNQRRRFLVMADGRLHPAYKRDCRHCFPVTIPNPEVADGSPTASLHQPSGVP